MATPQSFVERVTPKSFVERAASQPIPGMELLGALPGPAKPPNLALPWEAALQQATPGADIPQRVLDTSSGGVGNLVRGIERVAGSQGEGKQLAVGGTEILGGAMQTAVPVLPAALIAAPVGTALTLGASMLADKGASAGLEAVGAGPEYAGLGGIVAGLLVGAGGARALFAKARAAAGNPEIKIGGKFPEPKPFGEMTDPELVAHATKIGAEKPANYDWQKQEIVKEVMKRQAARGLPGLKATAPATPLSFVPSAIQGGGVLARGRITHLKGTPKATPVVPAPLAPVVPAPVEVQAVAPEIPAPPSFVAAPQEMAPSTERGVGDHAETVGETLFALRKLESQAAKTPAVLNDAPAAPADVIVPQEPINAAGTPRRQPGGEGTPVSGPGSAGGSQVKGERTTVRTGGGSPHPAAYSVRELGDVQPSHNAFTFEKNPKYQYLNLNDRDYTDPLNQARVVENSNPGNFDPAYLITDNPDAVNGPPIIDVDGNVLGGNNRRMTLERAYKNPASAQAYRELLQAKAAYYGLDPAEVAKMKQPVLVRELTQVADSQRAITDFNKAPTGKLSTGEQALADSRSITPETAKYISATLESFGADASLTDVLNSKLGPNMVNRLIREGIFTEAERPALFDSQTGAVTKVAKDRVSKMLVGNLFEDSGQFQRLQPSLRNKLERIAPLLKQIEARPGWDLSADIRQAATLIEYEAEYKAAHGFDVNSKLAKDQPEMFGSSRPDVSPRAEHLADFLAKNSATSISKTVRGYVEKSQVEATLTTPEANPTAEYNSAFGTPPGVSNPAEAAFNARKGPRRDSSERGSISLKPVQKSIEEEGPEFTKEPSAFRTTTDFFKPLETRIGQEGPHGKELRRKIVRAADVGEMQAGKRVVRLRDSGLQDLPRADRQNLVDSLQGHATPKNAEVQKAFDGIRGVTDEIRADAMGARIMVKEKRTLRPEDPIPAGAKLTSKQLERRAAGQRVSLTYQRKFRGRSDFYPHVIPSADALQSGDVRRDVIDNLTRSGIRADSKAAAEFIDEYRGFLDQGGRALELEEFLVDSGQARDVNEASMLLNRFRKRALRRQGSLEYSRQADLPFYDPDPGRVLPKFITASSMRLAQVREFGQHNEQINKLIRIIDQTSGNPGFTRMAVDRILGQINEADTGTARISRAVRTFNGFKLGLSFIPNATQGALNSLIKSDLPSTLAGAKGLMTAEGRRFAMQSGASLEGVVTEMLRSVGSESSGLGTFLKATGFSATEQANRIWAANAGHAYAKRMLQQLQKNPLDGRARKVLAELGLKPDVLLKLGKIDGDAALIAAKKFSDITQFRSAAKDVPEFASTPLGKVAFQFKTFLYGQTRLVYSETVEELKAGRPGRAFRTLLLLATVFPVAGEVIADLRGWATGRERKTEGIKRWLEDIGQAGGLGIITSLIEAGSYRKGVEFIAGPTGGELGQIIDFLSGKNPARDMGKWVVKHVPFLGPLFYHRIFPPKEPAPSPAMKKLMSKKPKK